MISYFLWLMNLVRTKILEGLNLPELDISYWEFCIILAVVGVVATVLLNSVRVGGSAAIGSSEKRRSDEQRRQAEIEKKSYSHYKSERERNEAYDDRYRVEHGQKLRKR